MRLIRAGKVNYGENPAIEGQTDLMRIKNSGAITPGKKLEAGIYVLQTVVANNTVQEKSGYATQFAKFEIVK